MANHNQTKPERTMMNKTGNTLSALAKIYEDRSRRDGAENEYLIQENARLRKELKEVVRRLSLAQVLIKELEDKIERSKQ